MVLSHNAASRPERYQDPHLEVDFASASAWLDSHPIILNRKEYALLSLLVRNAGEIVPRDALLWRIWGYSAQIRTRTLDVHIRRLRRKLGNYSDQYIETIFRSGYRFRPFRPEPPLRDYYTVSAVTPRTAPCGNM
jgi:DNA-binding response OmpR family regulator